VARLRDFSVEYSASVFVGAVSHYVLYDSGLNSTLNHSSTAMDTRDSQSSQRCTAIPMQSDKA